LQAHRSTRHRAGIIPSAGAGHHRDCAAILSGRTCASGTGDISMKKRARKRTRSSCIAERVLQVGSHRRERMIVRLGKPQYVAEGEWKCPVEIIKGENTASLDVHGLDAFQSLIIALDAIRDELKYGGRPVTWQGGRNGDPGFPLQVPQMLGQGFSVKLEKMIEAEMKRLNTALRRRSNRQHRT
jgi:hypothetical protein